MVGPSRVVMVAVVGSHVTENLEYKKNICSPSLHSRLTTHHSPHKTNLEKGNREYPFCSTRIIKLTSDCKGHSYK